MKYSRSRVLHAATHLLGELVGDDPGDCLTFDLCLVVDALDGEEDLPQRPGLDDVMHELNCQTLAVVYHVGLQSGTKSRKMYMHMHVHVC